MSERPILLHSSYIQDAVEGLPERLRFAFGVACCQRILPLLGENTGNAKVDVAGNYLEKVWRWTADLDDAPDDPPEVLESLIPSDEMAGAHQEWYQSALLFYELACFVAENRSSEIWRISDGCFALLDNYLYRTLALPVSGENDRIIDNHPLVVQAMQWERDDIDLMGARDSNSIFAVWKRSKQQQLLSLSL